ncbi:MAG TPA: hypothetical protein VLW50_18375 [Streptosporangiaceae bacterium]|nr:hypothetical protein [Streptosporangiaceae bacterium]
MAQGEDLGVLGAVGAGEQGAAGNASVITSATELPSHSIVTTASAPATTSASLFGMTTTSVR